MVRIENKFAKVAEKLGPKAIFNEPLSKHTILKVGGLAKIFYLANSIKDLVTAVKIAIDEKVAYLVLGQGANVLISDAGFGGLVIKNRADKISLIARKGKIEAGERIDQIALFEAAAGCTLVQLCRFTFDASLTGLEFLYAIPGTVGGAIKINSHGKPAKNEFIGNLIWEVTLLTSEGKIKKVNQNYFKFSYDYSKIIDTGEIVLSAIFKLKYASTKEIWAKALDYFNARKASQPYDLPSAGCFFQNISPSQAARLGLSDQIYSTGMLIAQAGLAGTQIGGAKISEKHSNFFVNTGNAKACDFTQLINLAKSKVEEKFGIKLKEEIFYIGKF